MGPSVATGLALAVTWGTFAAPGRSQVPQPDMNVGPTAVQPDPRLEGFKRWAQQEQLLLDTPEERLSAAVRAIVACPALSAERDETAVKHPFESPSPFPPEDYVADIENGAMQVLYEELALSQQLKGAFMASRTTPLSNAVIEEIKNEYTRGGRVSYFEGTEMYIRNDSLRLRPPLRTNPRPTLLEMTELAQAMEREMEWKVYIAEIIAKDLIVDLQKAKSSSEKLQKPGDTSTAVEDYQHAMQRVAVRWEAILAIRIKCMYASMPQELFRKDFLSPESPQSK